MPFEPNDVMLVSTETQQAIYLNGKLLRKTSDTFYASELIDAVCGKCVFMDSMDTQFDEVPEFPENLKDLIAAEVAPVETGHELQLDTIREAIKGYYADLDQRKHGGIAQDQAFRKIERILGMHWEQGASLKPKD